MIRAFLALALFLGVSSKQSFGVAELGAIGAQVPAAQAISVMRGMAGAAAFSEANAVAALGNSRDAFVAVQGVFKLLQDGGMLPTSAQQWDALEQAVASLKLGQALSMMENYSKIGKGSLGEEDGIALAFGAASEVDVALPVVSEREAVVALTSAQASFPAETRKQIKALMNDGSDDARAAVIGAGEVAAAAQNTHLLCAAEDQGECSNLSKEAVGLWAGREGNVTSPKARTFAITLHSGVGEFKPWAVGGQYLRMLVGWVNHLRKAIAEANPFLIQCERGLVPAVAS